MNKLKLVVSLLVFLSLFSIGKGTTSDAQKSINLDNGLMINSRTLIPLREIFEELGASVEWDGTTKTVNASKGGTRISLKIGSTQVMMNGVVKTIDVPGKILNGKTFVPLRFVSEALGADVKWDGETATASILTSEKEIYVTVRPYFELNGEKFVYDGELKNGLPHGYGIAIKGTSIYGDVLHEGNWSNGKPLKRIQEPQPTQETSWVVNGKNIKMGMTKEQVVGLIGKPTDSSGGINPFLNQELWGYNFNYQRQLGLGEGGSGLAQIFFSPEGQVLHAIYANTNNVQEDMRQMRNDLDAYFR